MRPLSRPAWRPRWAESDASEVPRYGLGFFCAACEMPLPQEAVAWHAGEGYFPRRRATIVEWPDLLALCRRCAHAAYQQGAPPPEVLLPHRELTFTLAAPSPLRYDRDGEGRVSVVAQDGRASVTVAYFALNGLLPRDPGPEVGDVEAFHATVDYLDPRPGLRERAWEQASLFAAELRDTVGEERRRLVRMIHLAAASTGFWSVWATVLWQSLQDADVLATALLPPAAPLRAEADAVAAEPPGHHAFGGTRRDWLPGAAGRGG